MHCRCGRNRRRRLPSAITIVGPGRQLIKRPSAGRQVLLVSAEPEALLAYVQLRALVGGTTAIQGWPTANRQHVQVLRDIDEEKASSTNRNLIHTSALTLPLLELGKMAQAENTGEGFIYHCAEGQPGSVVAQEFTDVATPVVCKKHLSEFTATPLAAKIGSAGRPRTRRARWYGRHSPIFGCTARPQTSSLPDSRES